MSEFSERIQSKISSYIRSLNSRFTSKTTFYQLSIGSTKSAQDAALDKTPVINIYTDNDSVPDIGVIIYIEPTKSDTFNGFSKYYNVFDSNDIELGIVITVNKSGIVTQVFT
jgi:hypothetical protein